jgi:hypothetical protein
MDRHIADAKYQVEQAFEYRKWANDIPALDFKPEWLVKVIPPFAGAVVRFIVTLKENPKASVSVYLDCYDQLGIMGMKPHWEIYPNATDDNERFWMNDTNELLAAISESLTAQHPTETK